MGPIPEQDASPRTSLWSLITQIRREPPSYKQWVASCQFCTRDVQWHVELPAAPMCDDCMIHGANRKRFPTEADPTGVGDTFLGAWEAERKNYGFDDPDGRVHKRTRHSMGRVYRFRSRAERVAFRRRMTRHLQRVRARRA